MIFTSKFPKVGPSGPKMAQDGPQIPQDSSKMTQDCAKMGQDGPRIAQDKPKMAPNRAKMGPRRAQRRQDGPRWAKIEATKGPDPFSNANNAPRQGGGEFPLIWRAGPCPPRFSIPNAPLAFKTFKDFQWFFDRFFGRFWHSKPVQKRPKIDKHRCQDAFLF